MKKLKEQLKAVKSKIRNPEINLNEKVMDNIKDLNVDEEIEVTATLKVLNIGREIDYDMPVSENKENYERPKILNARFEVKDIKKIK